jgi:hypothetical protein
MDDFYSMSSGDNASDDEGGELEYKFEYLKKLPPAKEIMNKL